MFVYGYCRISTPQQNIERQVRNIAAAYPAAHIVREVYTGTASQGRRELDKLLRIVQEGDTIVFDSVSRMSRSADEGCALYETLYKRGVNLCFFEGAAHQHRYLQAGFAAADRYGTGDRQRRNGSFCGRGDGCAEPLHRRPGRRADPPCLCPSAKKRWTTCTSAPARV